MGLGRILFPVTSLETDVCTHRSLSDSPKLMNGREIKAQEHTGNSSECHMALLSLQLPGSSKSSHLPESTHQAFQEAGRPGDDNHQLFH